MTTLPLTVHCLHGSSVAVHHAAHLTGILTPALAHCARPVCNRCMLPTTSLLRLSAVTSSEILAHQLRGSPTQAAFEVQAARH